MTRSRQIGPLLLGTATVLSLAACGTSAPSAAGSYAMTFVCTTEPGTQAAFFPCNETSHYALVLAGDGHFVMRVRGPQHDTVKGMWSETGDRVTLSVARGTTKTVLSARQQGDKLRDGGVASNGPANQGYRMTWYAAQA